MRLKPFKKVVVEDPDDWSDRWGIEDNILFSDSTFFVLLNFISDRYISSPYMTASEILYISSQVLRDARRKPEINMHIYKNAIFAVLQKNIQKF